MRSDGPDSGRREAGLSAGLEAHRSEDLRELDLDCAHAVDFVRTRDHERKQARAQGLGVAFVAMGVDRDRWVFCTQFDTDRIHTVCAGSRHKPNVMHRGCLGSALK